MNKVLYSSKNQNCCTPQAFFDKLNAEFNFVLDAAATDKSAKCRLYFTLEKNGLMQDWNCDGAVFCNPPYGREIKMWVKKAYEESIRSKYPIVLLVPARTDTSWFHDYIYQKAEIRFIQGRMKFTDEDRNKYNSAPFSSMVVIFRGKEK